MSASETESAPQSPCNVLQPRPAHGDSDVYWCEELLGLAGEGLLRRVGEDVELGLEEIEYKGLIFGVLDDDKGWAYRHGAFVFRNLGDILLYLEGVLRLKGEVAVKITGVVPESGEAHGGQQTLSYHVDLDDALGNWESDYLYGVPTTARFESFEEAKKYVVGNLLSVAQDLLGIVGEVQRSETYADLDLCGDGLITEEDETTDRG